MAIVAMLGISLILVLLTATIAVYWRINVQGEQPERVQVVALSALGAVSLFCVFGLLYLSSPPAASLSTAVATDPAVASAIASTNESILGLAGQIVSVLATIGAAAVGGITGLLVQRRGQDEERRVGPAAPGPQPEGPAAAPGPQPEARPEGAR